MKHICKKCEQIFLISKEDKSFYKNVSPQIKGQTFEIPSPQNCPSCRQQQRLSFRNLRSVYMRKCDLTGKSILSTYDKNCKTPVYSSEAWWGDKWDGLDYGQDFDFNRPFFEQFNELYKKVPRLQNSTLLTENCDYINGAGNCKDCYLSFNMDYCEQCFYITESKYMTSCVDCLSCNKSELCYECITCEKSYNLKYSQRSTNCQDSYFLTDCNQCKNCIACTNLVGKEYHIFNESVDKKTFEAFEEKLQNYSEIKNLEKKVLDFNLKFPKKYYYGHSNEDFSGDRIQNAKKSFYCFDVFNVENCKYCYYSFNSKNCMDQDLFGDNCEWIYNCLTTGFNSSNNSFCMFVWNGSSNNLYSHLLSGSNHNFGCSGLKHKKYCILNKQYTKEAYEALVPKIINHMKETGEWGEFFPASMSPYGYNETQALEFYPQTEKEAKSKGFNWKIIPEKNIPTQNIILAKNIPENIKQVKDSIIDWVILCEQSGKPFKITTQELNFYKKQNLPLPHVHPEIRHKKRLSFQNLRRLYDRNCGKCKKSIKTSYSNKKLEITYCEDCYLKEIY